MRVAVCFLEGALWTLACGAQSLEMRAMAEQIVPQVGVTSDAEFFAAWNLDHSGLEQVKAAVAGGDYAQATIALKTYFLQRRMPKWRFNHWEIPPQPRGSAETHSKYTQGEDVLAHRFDGYQFGEQIDWNCYPKKKPDGTPDTEYSPSPVTFKHASNVLGQLYWHSLDERYAKEFTDEVTDFVTRYPAPEKHASYGPCMWSRLRSISPLCGTWFDCYNYFLPSQSFTPEAHAVMLRGFIEKARYAVRNPDRVNRYFAQLRGIYAFSCYFPELRCAAELREFAVAAMHHAIAAEFYPDTSSKELCPGYQGMYVSGLMGFVENSVVMGYDVPPALKDAYERCCSFYLFVLTPLQNLPQFGDTPPRPSLAKNFSTNVVRFVDRPDFRWLASHGKDGAPPGFRSVHLPWAGFYTMRSGWDERSLYLCFDAGPLGKGHFHEDFGNFECYAYGERLIGDMGVYSYTFSEWRQYFVSSLAHNVVLVDGFGQNRAGSPAQSGLFTADRPRTNDWHSDEVFDLAWGHYAARWGDYRDGNHWFCHYGREQAVDLAEHRRDICFVKNSYWVISDRLVAEGQHDYAQLFHLDPGRSVETAVPGRARTTDAGRANIAIVQADPVTAQVVAGCEKPVAGWIARGGFEKEAAPELRFEQRTLNQAHYDTVLLPLDIGQAPDVEVTRLAAMDVDSNPIAVTDLCALRIRTPHGMDYYLNDLRQQDIGPINGSVKIAGPVRTDARAAVVRLDAQGTVTSVSATGASLVELDGRTIWPR